MMANLDDRERALFSNLWDACSQMDTPIQESLSEIRKSDNPLFGNTFDTLTLDALDQYSLKDNIASAQSIDEVLALQSTATELTNEEHMKEHKYEPIIDFPNFLMHIFKLYYEPCQLNANYLLTTFNDIGKDISPIKFIKTLLKVRTLFDRYIIKMQGEDEEEENIKWVIKKPYAWWSKEKKRNVLRFRNTFTNQTNEADENEKEESDQERIIMQESMLQVTFRNKKYKNWLFDLLQWLSPQEVNAINPKEMSAYLDQWIMQHYQWLKDKTTPAPNTTWAFEALGTSTPHFVFNYIDYLYWVAYKNKMQDFRYLDDVGNFYFKYYNSVEHHLPQSYVNTDSVNVDNIANLCLISRRKNSSLNDKAPKEKAKIEAGLQPKRKIMYTITQDCSGQWGKKQIMDHYKDICTLLQHAHKILSYKK